MTEVMTLANQPILVLGATGQQGGAVARELLGRGHEVWALTRSPASAAAQAIARRGAGLVEGDLDDAQSISSVMAGAAAVFSVHTFMGPEGAAGEVSRGKRVAEAAAAVGVRHLVYSSVDGAERQSGVPHFESKWRIEQHLRNLGVATTVLRPTTFMDNFATVQRPQIVDGELVVRLALRPTTPLQMVATADIGVFAADAFERPEQHVGKAIALAGDELTGPQIAQVFREALAMPARYEQQPLDEVRGFSEDLALMYAWLNDYGYRADVAALRRRHPELRTLRDWLTQTAWRPSMPT